MKLSSPVPIEPTFDDPRLLACWRELDCRLPAVQPIFEASATQALVQLTEPQLHGFWGAGRQLGKLGRGAAPVIAWLTYWPMLVSEVGDDLLDDVMALIHRMHKSPNSAAIAPFIESLATAAQRLRSVPTLREFLHVVQKFMDDTTGSIHGHQQTFASEGLVPFFKSLPMLLMQLTLPGLRNWVEYGARVYRHHPQQQAAYFSLESDDSRAVMLRERHGTQWVDIERTLALGLQGMWEMDLALTGLPTQDTGVDRITPGLIDDAMGIPDALDDLWGVPALIRYRLMVAHMAMHREMSGQCVADNWSPTQRLAVEWFEDARVDVLMCQRWPGLKPWLLKLLPLLEEGACDVQKQACQRHRLAVWNRAVLDESFQLQDPVLSRWVSDFHAAVANGATTSDTAALALRFVAQTRLRSDALPDVWFEGTQMDWRDDNRHLWKFIEDGDEEDTQPTQSAAQAQELQSLPPRLYPEWDYTAQTERPDWVKVYEYLHPSADPSKVDALLQKHAGLARRLERVLDRLRPQGRERIRHLENGSELDLDVAQQAWVDWRSGHTPTDRVQQHIKPPSRDVAVQLVMDLSASLADRVPGSEQTVLEISQEAVAILGWALDRLGDKLAIGGFHSNTRHEVRYMHLKGFEEPWGDAVKARLAALEPAYSTRMGAALRHASRTLQQRKQAKKLLLILTDGEPADVDVKDPEFLVQDARKAVQDLQAKGVFVWCIHLHPGHDEQVQAIYGDHYTVVDHIQRLPELMASLFVRLTR